MALTVMIDVEVGSLMMNNMRPFHRLTELLLPIIFNDSSHKVVAHLAVDIIPIFRLGNIASLI